MSSIPPALPQPPTRQQGSASPTTATTTSEVSAAIAELPTASVLEAVVTALPTRGQVQLQTALGDLTVKLGQAVALNATIKLMVTVPGPQPQFRLLGLMPPMMAPAATPAPAAETAPALPPAEEELPVEPEPEGLPGLPSIAALLESAVSARMPEAPADPNLAGLGGSGTQLDLPEPQGPGLTALLLRPADGSDLPAGMRFTLRVLDMAPPGSTAELVPPTTSGGSTATAAPAASAPTRPAVGQLPAAPAGTAAPVTPDAAATPARLLPRIPIPGPLARLLGTADKAAPPVVAIPEPAEPEVPAVAASPDTSSEPAEEAAPPGEEPADPFAVQVSPDAAADAEPPPSDIPAAPPAAPSSSPETPVLPRLITGTVTPNSLAGAPLIRTQVGLITIGTAPDLTPGTRVLFATEGRPVMPPPAAQAEAPASDTPTLQNLVEAVRQLDSDAAEQLAARLPQLGSEDFVPNALIMMSAIQSGDVRSWLGAPAVKALDKAGRRDLIDRLGGDFAGMRGSSAPAGGPSAWQAFSMPMMVGQRVEPIRILVRRPERPDDNILGLDEEGLRFLVDVDMSRLGPIQLDGLIKRKAKRFDLILRSRTALEQGARADIGGIFGRALEGLGMTGQVLFQPSAAFLQPVPPTRPAGARITI